MNVFALGAPGYGIAGAGGFVFGSGWGTADLRATFAAGPVNPLTLSPNTIGDPDPFWYTPSGGPGATGNKIMDASMYVEPGTGLLAGENVTFTGTVLANTLTTLGNVDGTGHGWTSVAFIKDFDPTFSSHTEVTIPLTPGVFSITLATNPGAGRHVQYGFETIGPDVWVTDVGPFGNIQIVPEPSSIGLAVAGLLGFVTVLRKRRA